MDASELTKEENIDCLKTRLNQLCSCDFQFNDSDEGDDRSPLLLPCLHFSCIQCVERNIHDGIIKCPWQRCKRSYYIGDNISSKLPKDKFKRDVLDLVQMSFQKSQIVCSSCRSNAKFHCNNCYIFLCKLCKERHTQQIKSHKIVLIHKIDTSPEILQKSIRERKCSIHTNMPVKYHCSTCKKSLCDICYPYHVNHRTRIIQTEGEAYRRRLDDLLNAIEKNFEKVELNILHMEKKIEILFNQNTLVGKDSTIQRERYLMLQNFAKRLEELRDYRDRLKRGKNIAVNSLHFKDSASLTEDSQQITFNLQCLVTEFEKIQMEDISSRKAVSAGSVTPQKSFSKPMRIKSAKAARPQSSGIKLYCEENSFKEESKLIKRRKQDANEDLKGVIKIKIKEFPTLSYLLNESSIALDHMASIITDIEECLKENIVEPMLQSKSLASSTKIISRHAVYSYTEPKEVLLHEIRNMKFRWTHVWIKVIGGDDALSVVINALTNSKIIDTESISICDENELKHQPQVNTFCICLQNESGMTDKNRNTKMLSHLQSLSAYELRNVVFITQNDQARIEELLRNICPEVFETTPLLATKETLRKVMSDLTLKTIYDRLETLLSTLRICYTKCGIVDEKRSSLEEAIEDIISLLQERNRINQTELKSVPKNVYDSLSRLLDKGVKACSMYGDHLLVFVEKNAVNWEELNKEIKQIVEKSVESCVVFRSEWPIFKFLISAGEEIIPERELCKNDTDKFGTLGAFAKADASRVVALTSGHVALKNENVYTHEKKLIGKCSEGPDRGDNLHLADLSVIEISPSDLPDGYMTFKDATGEPCNLSLPEVKINRNQRVFKLGAKTGLTRGRVVAKFQHFDQKGEFVIVQGFHNTPFAEGGDSGSVVYMRDVVDKKPPGLIAITMVAAGEINHKELDKKHVQKASNLDELKEHDLKNCACTFMLKDAFEKIKDKVKLEFFTPVNH